MRSGILTSGVLVLGILCGSWGVWAQDPVRSSLDVQGETLSGSPSLNSVKLLTGQEGIGDKKDGKDKKETKLKKPSPIERFFGAAVDAIKDKLGLTDEQKAKLDSLIAELQPKLEDLRAKREAIEKEARDLRSSAMERFNGILTEDQKVKMKDMVHDKRNEIGDRMVNTLMNLKALKEKLDLSEEQIKEIREMMGDVRGELRKIHQETEGDREKFREAVKGFQDKLVQEIKQVLNDQQKGALDEFLKAQKDHRGKGEGEPRKDRPRKKKDGADDGKKEE